MLRLVRALGFLAPLAVTVCAMVVLTTTQVPGTQTTLVWIAAILAAIAGMTTMALAAWSYVGWRLSRIAGALEATLVEDTVVSLRETGIPAERRLARAFNAAAGAFLQTEARATHDRLTGIANRETLLTTLVAEVERAVRHYKPLSVAFIDIDRFKPINDTYGHNSGDAVLRQVAAIIADNLRPSDMFGRYGGEEFMLILPETMPDEAVEVAERLRDMVAQTPLLIARQQSTNVTISLGIAGGRGSELQVDALVDQADAAMYAAKSLGRNRTYVYRELDEEAPVRRAPISPDRRGAPAPHG
jgi:diguanylate cyclase (GGDEF)-like protein